jgi:hypothetical protein
VNLAAKPPVTSHERPTLAAASWCCGTIRRIESLRLPGTNGTDALVALRGEFPRAMRAGASAYLLKSMPKDELLAVVR